MVWVYLSHQAGERAIYLALIANDKWHYFVPGKLPAPPTGVRFAPIRDRASVVTVPFKWRNQCHLSWCADNRRPADAPFDSSNHSRRWSENTVADRLAASVKRSSVSLRAVDDTRGELSVRSPKIVVARRHP